MLWLSGWFYRKNHVINPAAGAGLGYQVRVTVHYGAGTDAGEDVYCSSLCRTDFGDIRFTDDSNNPLDYWLQSKTDGGNGVFWVEVAGSLEATSQTLYVYYGKSNAATTSNQANTFVDVVSGVVGAWNMEETSGQTVTDYSGNSNSGNATGTTVVDGKFAGKKARQFNGSSDHISFTAPTINNAFSVFCFFKKQGASGGSYHGLINGVRGYTTTRMLLSSAGTGFNCQCRESTNTSTISNSSLIADVGSTFHSFVHSMDGSFLTKYVDGTLIGSQVACNGVYGALNAFEVGRGQGSDYFANGVLCCLFLTSSPLTQSQITNLNAYYPDITLDPGKVLVRKYATTTQPSHNIWGNIEHFVSASDSFSSSDEVLRNKLLGISDSVGMTDAPLGFKGLLLSDSVGAVDGLAALKALFVCDLVGLSDLFLALKGLDVADELMLLDWVSVPLRVRAVLDSVCLADGLAVNKVLKVAEDVFVAEAAEVGSGDRRTRLFLILGNVAIQLTKNA